MRGTISGDPNPSEKRTLPCHQPPKRPFVLVRPNSASPTKSARHHGLSSEDCLIERAGLFASTVPKRTFRDHVDKDRFNLQKLSLTFVRKTPQPFFISFDSPFYRVSLPRGLFLLYSVNLSPFIPVFKTNEGQYGHYNDGYWPCHIETTSSRTSPTILSHILEITNHVLFQRETHRTYLIVLLTRGPRSSRIVILYRQCPSPNHHETHTTTSYPLHPLHVLSSPSSPPAPFQQQRVAFAPLPSYSASDFNVPSHLRCAINPLQPRFDRMRIRIKTSGTKEIYPSCRSSSSPVRPFPRVSANAWSVQFSPRRGWCQRYLPRSHSATCAA